ncbi:hypothetical protein BC835DRAFT_1409170 [Cytidiella melzeri]|nr:hypothetical protein BC835DRAFT_1409170 [Cytidiella melzeri]
MWQYSPLIHADTSTLLVEVTDDAQYPNIAIAKRGYLGTAPRTPKTAIAFNVLEAYRQLHRVCPKLSVYAQVQALCHLHGNPFNRSFVEQFSATFDVYLEILHRVESRVNVTLRRDTPEWRLRNACPPCMYTLTNEPDLGLSMLCSMDGNSSLKLVDSSVRCGDVRQDERTHRIQDLLLTPDMVDIFKDEVASSSSGKAPAVQHNGDNEHPSPNLLSSADCVEKWRAAAPEERKRAFALFHTTGVFASFCRHGHALVYCDMIRSGELRKYALAVIDRLMAVFGSHIGLGYDVGCDTSKTVMSSSLQARAEDQHLRLIVPAFHGHQHNRLCQLDWHPMYIKGAGKEDFEGCERAFKDSNMLASGTRLSTAFHRHQAIEQHWSRVSCEYNVCAGTFLLHNYKQALGIIRKDGADLRILSAKLGTTSADYIQYFKAEKMYLEGLKKEPEEVSLRLEYLDTLQELEEAQHVRGAAITAVKNRYRNAWRKLEEAEAHTVALEEQLSIGDRWTSTHPEYVKAMSEMTMRKYRLALDKLERLVVQRLLELTKLSMGGIGTTYKLREKIGQALRTRAEAIRKALDEYNKQASLLNPPRPKLRWEELIDLSSVGAFDLLRNARQDIRELKWADPLHREATRLYFNIQRAQEELTRCNVEVRRILTSMYDEHLDYWHAVALSIIPNPTLACELSKRWVERDRINACVARRLQQIALLPGFSGALEIGQRVGRNYSSGKIVPAPAWAMALGIRTEDAEWVEVDATLVTTNDHDEDDDDDDAEPLEAPSNTETAEALVDFIDRLEIS